MKLRAQVTLDLSVDEMHDLALLAEAEGTATGQAPVDALEAATIQWIQGRLDFFDATLIDFEYREGK